MELERSLLRFEDFQLVLVLTDKHSKLSHPSLTIYFNIILPPVASFIEFFPKKCCAHF